VHAPTSGTVADIAPRPVPHPSGLEAACVVIEADGRDEPGEGLGPLPDWRERDPRTLRARVREAGIVGMGGAGFPTHVKLNPGPGRRIETLVINGAECEPYISCDDMLMRERPEEVLGGAEILRRIVGAGRALVGVEEDKPQALAALRAAARELRLRALEVVPLPVRYPSGG